MNRPLRILVWHVHGGWMESFVRSRHQLLLPTLPERGPQGLGRGGRDWPATAQEVPVDQLADTDVDVVVLQRTEEFELAERWLRRRPGRDLPCVFLEHNTPRGDVPSSRHPVADRDDLLLVHVTHFNDLMWDAGSTPTAVVPHGIVDPGDRYTGELARAAVVVNEPVRRWRVTGTDLLPALARAAPLDVFGMGLTGLNRALGGYRDRITPVGDLRTDQLHTELARRRVYLHPVRWTSLGLSLLEAMHLGMPVVALATTEAVTAVPPDAGVLATDVTELVAAVRQFTAEPELARRTGQRARRHALARHGLTAFLDNWDQLLARLVSRDREVSA